MNELFLLTNFLVEKFNENVLVNTISLVETKHIDNNKENIYCLVNIDYLESETLPDAIIASYLITVVQQRDIRPQKTDSKLRLDTNLVDNWAETLAVISNFLNQMRSNIYIENHIELRSNTQSRKLENFNKNGLDGHQITIELAMPNLGSGC
jgi:hypothetical protein